MGPLRSARTLPYHQRNAPRTSSNLTQTAPSAPIDPPGKFGEAAQDTDVLPAEVLMGWFPYRCVHMLFTSTCGVKTLGHAEVTPFTDDSGGDSSNGRAPQVALLIAVEGCFQIPIHV